MNIKILKYISWCIVSTCVLCFVTQYGSLAYAVEAIDSTNDNAEVVTTNELNITNSDEIKTIDDGNQDEIENKLSLKEIDLGDYQSEMIVGERQLLVCTILPEGLSNREIIYKSSNTSVATINGIGRIVAQSVGETTITVSCFDISNSFKLSVKNKTDEKVAVTDIEISDYEQKLRVGDVMTISAKVLPFEATENTVYYWSEDTEIATVNSSGEVKGIKKGDVAIYVSAGGVTKKVNIKVVVNTKKINVSNNYFLLKPGENSKIEATVYPEDSPQLLKYKSLNPSVAEVSSDGVVKGKNIGNTCIVVSNDEQSISVTVIVNSISGVTKKEIDNDFDESKGVSEPIISCEGIIDSKSCDVISEEMLKYLYENDKSTIVIGNGYSIRVDGDKILNFSNELLTDISFSENSNGDYEFIVNAGNNICGEIIISFNTTENNFLEGKNLYLYNDSKKIYEKIQYETVSGISISRAGKYLFSDDEKINIEAYKLYLIYGAGVIILLSFIFIVLKKKYWFW